MFFSQTEVFTAYHSNCSDPLPRLPVINYLLVNLQMGLLLLSLVVTKHLLTMTATAVIIRRDYRRRGGGLVLKT